MAQTPGVSSGRMALPYVKGAAQPLIYGTIMVIKSEKIIKQTDTTYHERAKEKHLNEELFKPFSSYTDTGDLYSEFFQNKLASIRGQIQEIDIELEIRQSIHGELTTEIDHQVLSALLFLDQLKHWAIGYRVGVDMERNLWERKVGDLLKEKRMEKLRVWRESASLKEGRRELLRDYEELVKRQRLLR